MKERYKIGSPITVVATIYCWAALIICIIILICIKFNHPDISKIPVKDPVLGEVFYYDHDNWYPAIDLDLTKSKEYIVVWIGDKWIRAEW